MDKNDIWSKTGPAEAERGATREYEQWKMKRADQAIGLAHNAVRLVLTLVAIGLVIYAALWAIVLAGGL